MSASALRVPQQLLGVLVLVLPLLLSTMTAAASVDVKMHLAQQWPESVCPGLVHLGDAMTLGLEVAVDAGGGVTAFTVDAWDGVPGNGSVEARVANTDVYRVSVRAAGPYYRVFECGGLLTATMGATDGVVLDTVCWWISATSGKVFGDCFSRYTGTWVPSRAPEA